MGSPVWLSAGLDPATSQALLNDLADRVYDKANRFTNGRRVSDLIAGYDAVTINGAAHERVSDHGGLFAPTCLCASVSTVW